MKRITVKQRKILKNRFNKLSKVSWKQSQMSIEDKMELVKKCLKVFNEQTCVQSFEKIYVGKVSY